jgi:CHAT domain-containing protein/tetratricopeptide (TPR) repeat protein
LLNRQNASCKALNPGDLRASIDKALTIAESRGLIRDRALVEATLGSLLIGDGKIEMAFLSFEKALQDSIDSQNEIAEADILISLASEAELKGNKDKALELLTRALTLSNKNASLYEKARALGSIGRLNMLGGKLEEARNSLDEALAIERLNGYTFEAQHLVYKASYLGLTGHEAQAMEILAQAKSRAIKARDGYAFVSAETTYAFGLVRQGKTDQALAELALVKEGKLDSIAQDANDRECLTNALSLPMLRIILLEGITNALEAANLKDKELDIWRELQAMSRDIGMLAGEAEASQKIANLESQSKRNGEAIRDYAITTELYRKVGNEALVNEAEISESILLVNAGRGTEAVPLVEEILSYARRLSLRELEFRASITLANIYQTSGAIDKARVVLEKATSMIHPGPFDSDIDNKAIHLAYVSLSDIYKQLHLSTKELVSIDQAFFVSLHLKDDEAQHREVLYLDQRLNELHIRDSVDQLQKDGKLSESLMYSYILYLRDGPAKDPVADHNWERILTLPFQIMQKPGGFTDLTDMLRSVGAFLGIEKLPLLTALARYYLGVGADPMLAERYALDQLNIVNGLKGDHSTLIVEATCVLALSHARQYKAVIAKSESAQCLDLAEKTHDEQSLVYAETVNSMVQAQTGNVAAAKRSLERLVARAPQDPELIAELAMSLASAKLYSEANTQLHSAIEKFLLRGGQIDAAGAYNRASIVLDSDASDMAKRFQLEYLDAALKLYHEAGANDKEAGALIALGDYFLKVNHNTSAVENYRKAQQLAVQIHDKNILGQTHLGLGNGYQAQKDFAKARDSHKNASDLFRELSNSIGQTIALRQLARDYYELNDPTNSITALIEARHVAVNAGSFQAYLVALYLGELYRSQGEYEKSLESYHDAVTITEKADDVDHLPYAHLALAEAHGFTGAWEDALTEIQVALEMFEKFGNIEGQGASWADLTQVYSDRTSPFKDFDKAKECYRKALELGYGKDLELEMMEIYLQTGKYAEAAKLSKERIQACLKENDNSCRAHLLISLSEAERLSGNLRASRSAIYEAGPLVTNSPDIYLKGRLEYQSSRLLTSEGKFDAALRSYEHLISLIEGIKGKLGPREQQSLSENYGFIYDEVVSLLYSMSQRATGNRLKLASDSLRYAEINKARQFAASWGRVFLNQMRQTLPPVIQERERSLISKRDGLVAQMGIALNGSDTNKAVKEKNLKVDLSAVGAEMKTFQADLRKVSPQYAAIAYPEEIQTSTIPLKKGETLVEFKMTGECTFGWVIQNNDGSRNDLVAFYKIAKKREWFLDRLSTLRKALNSGRPGLVDWKISEELFVELFPSDIAKIVLDSQEIIFVPDDVLFILPFELFSPDASKGNFVFLRKPTGYYPSAVSLKLARTASHQSNWQEAFLGVADPITSPEDDRFEVAGTLKPENRSPDRTQNNGNEKSLAAEDKLKARGFSFERLPGTAIEVRGIASLLKARNETVDVRSGASATKAELLDTDLSKFRFLHFATHGVLPVDTGVKEPSLILSYDGVAPSHMFLPMSEIIGLKLHSESVVLSACNTGSGKISRAEGVMSLGRAFLAAGSSSVTVSLWQVSDESTAVLMRNYYSGILQGKAKSVALAEARQAVYSNGSKDPFFWAPFIVIGE